MHGLGLRHGNDKHFTLPRRFNDGVWHQVVMTYNGTSLTVYVDGVALGSQAATRATVLDAYGFGIGAIIAPGDAQLRQVLQRLLDEVSFYTTALSQTTSPTTTRWARADPPTPPVPTGGSVDASGLVGTGSRYSTSTTLSLALAKGTDPSGLAAPGAQLLRATPRSTRGTAPAGAFGSTTLVAAPTRRPQWPTRWPTRPATATDYVVMDSLGNTTTYTSPSIKVDTTAPAAPTLAYSAFTNTCWTGSGTTVYYRSAAASGSFTTTAAATDPQSGIASYAFPALGTNWTSTPGALGVNTYSWTGAPAAPGTKNATATNNATLTSANAPFTLTADDTAPTAGTVTYEDTTQTSTTDQRHLHDRHRRGLGDRDPAAAARIGHPDRVHLWHVRRLRHHRRRHQPDLAAGQHRVDDCLLQVPVRRPRQRRQQHTATSASVVKVSIPCGAQLLGNPGFENGAVTAPWTASAGVVTNGGTVAARTGTWKALLGGNGTDTTETVSQDVYHPGELHGDPHLLAEDHHDRDDASVRLLQGPGHQRRHHDGADLLGQQRRARRTCSAPWTSPPTPARRSRSPSSLTRTAASRPASGSTMSPSPPPTRPDRTVGPWTRAGWSAPAPATRPRRP